MLSGSLGAVLALAAAASLPGAHGASVPIEHEPLNWTDVTAAHGTRETGPAPGPELQAEPGLDSAEQVPARRTAGPAVELPIHAGADAVPYIAPADFGPMFDNALLDNTRLPGRTPGITGNETVDRAILEAANNRGYTRRRTVADPSVLIEDRWGSLLQPAAAAAWADLRSRAAADGVVLTSWSGYRSPQRQTDVFLRALDDEPDLEDFKWRLKVSAPPGYSKHHTGYALDIRTGDIIEFDGTAGHLWISANGRRNLLLSGWIPSYPEGASRQGPDPESWEIVYVGLDEILCWHRDPLSENPLCDAYTAEKDRLRRLAATTWPAEVL